MQAVINYSRALADNNVNLTVPLIRVVKFFSPMCDIEEKIASLQFLIPWTINVAPLLLSDQVGRLCARAPMCGCAWLIATAVGFFLPLAMMRMESPNLPLL